MDPHDFEMVDRCITEEYKKLNPDWYEDVEFQKIDPSDDPPHSQPATIAGVLTFIEDDMCEVIMLDDENVFSRLDAESYNGEVVDITIKWCGKKHTHRGKIRAFMDRSAGVLIEEIDGRDLSTIFLDSMFGESVEISIRPVKT